MLLKQHPGRAKDCEKPFAIRAEPGDNFALMSSTIVPGHPTGAPTSSPKREVISEPNFAPPPKPIAKFAGRPDFPQCAYGEFVDIGGYAGVVVEIVNNSIKVRDPEGITQSFNFHRLRTLYSPAPRPETDLLRATGDRVTPVDEPAGTAPPAPNRQFIAEPDFDVPLQPIADFVRRLDFPGCAFGRHVDIGGYSGVVVEIVKQSLKVRSPAGVTRSYNAGALVRLYRQD